MAVNNLITLRKGIATEWSSQNPTLASGEPGYDGTNNILKIGDGATAWNDLDPIALSSVNEDGSPILGGELNLDNNDIVIDCRNETGSTIAAGTPVYVSGYYSNNGKPLIAPADASDSSKMPAFGILNNALNTDTEGTMGIMGVVSQVNTAGFDVGDVVYVASGGGYTNIKPILEDNLIQNLGRVLRVDASQGRILLLGAGRSNDVPNLDEGKIWVGSSGNTITSSTIHINETNARVGIGTASPDVHLHIEGTQPEIRQENPLSSSTIKHYLYSSGVRLGGLLGYGTSYSSSSIFDVGTSGITLFTDGGGDLGIGTIGGPGNIILGTNDTEKVRIDGSGNVGIGTDSPSYALDIRYPTSGGMALTKDSDSNDGLLFGDMAYSVSNAYQGIKHVSMIGTSDYMMMSAGTDNHVSAKAGSDLYLRGGGNSTVSQIKLTASEININDFGSNCDFRIEGDTDQNLLFTDASTDRVGIGTATPSYKLEVNGDIGLTDSGFYASPTGVMVGTSGWLYNDGQTTLSHGNFTDNGDAQNSSYVLRTSTTNDTFTTIANNGSSIRLSNNRTFMFTANIVARRTNGQDNAAYKLEGIIANDGYGASILGTPVKTILYESDNTWDVQAIITSISVGDSTSDELLIQGKGAASKNINWVCKLDLLEVGGDISGYTESNALGIQENIIP